VSPFVNVLWATGAPPAGGYPVVQATAVTSLSDQQTERIFALPSGIQSGDLIYLATRAGRNPVAVVTDPPGFTLMAATGGANSITRYYYRVADGSEGSTVSITYDGAARVVGVAYRISGVAVGAGSFIERTDPATGVYDPTNLAPSWGSAKTLWLSEFSARSSDWTVTPPTGYGTALTAMNNSNTDATYVGMVSVRKEAEAASDNPDAWVLASGGDSILSVRVTTVAVRPA
jgi:hypothetical protein